jgi:hypothetical protein
VTTFHLISLSLSLSLGATFSSCLSKCAESRQNGSSEKWILVLLLSGGHITTNSSIPTSHISSFLSLFLCACGEKMEANSASKWFFLCMVLFLSLQMTNCAVTYDRKAIVINGQRRILFSGSIHYPRSSQNVLFFLPTFI